MAWSGGDQGRRRGVRVAWAATVAVVTVAASALTACTPDQQDSTEAAPSTQADAPLCLTGGHVDYLPGISPITESPDLQLPVTLTDADGRDVTVTDTSRIVALDLYGSFTTTLIGLGLKDSIVGRTVSSTDPELTDVPLVNDNGHTVSAEAVLALSPTLILTDHSVRPDSVIDQLRDAGAPVVVVDPQRSIDAVGSDIQLIADVVGLSEEGQELAQRSEKEVADARTAAESRAAAAGVDHPAMTLIFARGGGGTFLVLGRGAGATGILEALGGTDASVEYGVADRAPASAEAFAQMNPDVIVATNRGISDLGGVEGLLERPGVNLTSAGSQGIVLSLPDSSTLSYGPQTGQLIAAAAEALYSECEAD